MTAALANKNLGMHAEHSSSTFKLVPQGFRVENLDSCNNCAEELAACNKPMLTWTVQSYGHKAHTELETACHALG